MRVEYTKSEPQRLQLYGSLYLLYHLQQTLKRIKHTLSFFGRALNNTSEQSEVSLFCVVMRSNAFGEVADARCEI